MESFTEIRAGSFGHEDVEVSDRARLPVKPLVSVCIITFQHVAFIREALDSILMQHVDFPYEICLGEDGSTDGTREICLEYARNHPDKIRLFLRDRSNPKRCEFQRPYMFNASATFDACRGKYIALLDGDDCWLNARKLQMQVEVLEADPGLAGVAHYSIGVQSSQPWRAGVAPDFPVSLVTIEAILRRDVGNLHTSTWLLRRGEPLPWHYFHTSSFGDYPIIVWTMRQGPARVLPGIMSLYRQHEQGVFSSLSRSVQLQQNVRLWELLASITPAGLSPAVKTGLIRTLIMHVAALVKALQIGRAWHAFRAVLAEINQLDPSVPGRGRLRLLALEALLVPHLKGVRNRWQKWRSKNGSFMSDHGAFNLKPEVRI